MNGRLEKRMKIERNINDNISDMPEYMQQFYYSIDSTTHNTKKVYVNNVIRFLNAYGNEKPVTIEMLQQVTPFTIQKYMSDISYYEGPDGEVRERSNASRANILSCLNSFFTFLYASDYINKNPFSKGVVKYPKVQEKEVVYLTAQEVRTVEKAIIDGVGTGRSKARQEAWKYRDFCLFWLPVINGIRVGALSEINVEDIDFKDKSIRCIEKGDKPVKIYFDDKAHIYLRLWMEQRKRLLGDVKCNALFISNQRRRMDVASIERVIQKYTKQAIDKRISPHKLRATFATNLYGQKRDIELVAKALHHNSTVPTQKYVKVLDADVRNAVNSNLYV